MGYKIEGPFCAPDLWIGGGLSFTLQATNPVREPQIGGRRCGPRAQDFVKRRRSLAGWRRGEKVEVVSHGAVR